jgi:lysophospholipase L1-like esterase
VSPVSYQLIAALGSSFAAGPGIEPIADPTAVRSERNYAHQLAERLGARLVDLTVSGATTANILDTPQQMVSGHVYPPQIDGVPADADVVTITAGGNDLQFAGAMLYAASLRLEPQSPMTARRRGPRPRSRMRNSPGSWSSRLPSAGSSRTRPAGRERSWSSPRP